MQHPMRLPAQMQVGGCQSGQALSEFGLVLALVAVAAIASLVLFGGVLSQMVQTIAQTVSINV